MEQILFSACLKDVRDDLERALVKHQVASILEDAINTAQRNEDDFTLVVHYAGELGKTTVTYEPLSNLDNIQIEVNVKPRE